MKRFSFLLPALIALFLYSRFVFFGLADPLFSDPYSHVATDREGGLLSAGIAGDGQWRFPPGAAVPEKFSTALTAYEDKRFFSHNGVDLVALGRAVVLNFRQRQVVSGASTLAMQVIRLQRKDRPRTVSEKLKEMILAMVLTLKQNKNQVLQLFASHAPFGGNVVGLEAAAWRYFGRPSVSLSWADCALLAVLPNSPALIHPGRNREELLKKRNTLLERLYRRGYLDWTVYTLALEEPVPPAPLPLPREAPHLLERLKKTGLAATGTDLGSNIKTTIDGSLQRRLNEVAGQYGRQLRNQGIANLGILVLETLSGEVLAYVGNTPLDETPASYVDMVGASRSTGSLLKPLLYTAMIDAGELLPRQLVLDIPTRMGTYRPENPTRTYLGAVRADTALAESLNVPAARLLREFGIHRFYGFLEEIGMKTLVRSADQYGVSMVLGGAEGTLENLTSLYALLARTVTSGSSREAVFPPRFFPDESIRPSGLPGDAPFHPGSAYLTLMALEEVGRPEEERGWRDFLSSRPVSWKTGTSYGFRDAWALGTTPEHTVGVWAGNASGEGNPAIQGSRAAAPLLFRVLALLNDRQIFKVPSQMILLETCRQSGFLAGPDCPETEMILYPPVATPGTACPYHKGDRFVLPPVAEWYYSRWNLDYRGMGATAVQDDMPMDLPFPAKNDEIYIPVEMDGSAGAVVFEVFHRQPERTVFWHLDEQYLGATQGVHQMELKPSRGRHKLTVLDDRGNLTERWFQVLSR